jgi:hypothetical protein
MIGVLTTLMTCGVMVTPSAVKCKIGVLKCITTKRVIAGSEHASLVCAEKYLRLKLKRRIKTK